MYYKYGFWQVNILNVTIGEFMLDPWGKDLLVELYFALINMTIIP